MNERIKELGRQAMSDVMNGSDPYGDADRMYIPAEFMEKFAELIVRECISAVQANYIDRGTTEAVITIENRFGVE
jgi:hypothetical protein